MSWLKESIDFLSQYPAWIKLLAPALVLAAFLLLVLFRPHPPADASEKKEASGEVTVGNELVMDLSKGQASWNGLTGWAKGFSYPIRELHAPFKVSSFPDWQPGVLILALPKDSRFSDEDVAAIKSWVERGGGLMLLGYYAADTHHGGNPSRLLREWGVSFEEDLLLPSGSVERDARAHVFSSDPRFGISARLDGLNHEVLGRVDSLLILSSASVSTRHASAPVALAIASQPNAERWRPVGPLGPDGGRPIIEEWVRDRPESLPIAVLLAPGRGRVAILGSWKIATLDLADNRQFVANVVNWLRPRR